jgi:hypothetical protein
MKYKSDGTLDRYKARLITNGYLWTSRIDYEEIFAPVAKMNIARFIVSKTAHFDWDLLQFDVKNVSFPWLLKEEVYMKIPLGYKLKEENVCAN